MEKEIQGQEEELETPAETQGETPEENETPDTQEGVENEEVDDEPESSGAEKPEKSEKDIKSLQAQKDHWRKKALEAEKKAKLTQKPKEYSQDEWQSRVDFLLKNRDVSEEEYDHLAAVAQRRSGAVNVDSLQEAQKAEADYITYRRKRSEEKNKIPKPSSASSTSYEKKITPDMTSEQIDTVLKERFEKAQQSGDTGF